MLFVTVGTMGFDRLTQAMDAYARTHDEPVRIQIGNSEMRCENAEAVPYVADLVEAVRAARVVVCHAGIGTLATMLGTDTPFVLFPRRKQFGEAHDDHQWEFVQRTAQGLPCTVAKDVDDLERAIQEAPERRRTFRYQSTRPQLTDAIAQTIGKLCMDRGSA